MIGDANTSTSSAGPEPSTTATTTRSSRRRCSSTSPATASCTRSTCSPRRSAFLERFRDTILRPRGLDYKVQFPGPTGTNSVEAALKLARKVTGREGIVGFTNAFHGMTLGALSVTGNSMKRGGAGVPLANGTSMPYDGYLGDGVDTIGYLESFLDDSGSGLDLPAAVIVETVQAEGASTSPASIGSSASPTSAGGTTSSSSSTTSRPGAGGPARSSASNRQEYGPTSSASRSPSAATACRWR